MASIDRFTPRQPRLQTPIHRRNESAQSSREEPQDGANGAPKEAKGAEGSWATDLLIAATVLFAFVVVLLLILLVRRYLKTAKAPRGILGNLEYARNRFQPRTPAERQRSGRISKTGGLKIPLLAYRPPPLDDAAILRMFTDLDLEIEHHVINFWHNNDITSATYQDYINSTASRQSWTRILYDGRPLLVNIAARIQMFRAILAYHVYTAIVDWRMLSDEERSAVSKVTDELNRGLVRRNICRELEKSDINTTRRVHIIYELLEGDSKHHLTPEGKASILRQESLKSIAAAVVYIGFQLGIQPDEFKFEFRNKDNSQNMGKDLMAVKLLGALGVDNSTTETVNGMGDATVRALISPGIIRLGKGSPGYLLRKSVVFTA